jgi:hypothetical protein
MGMEGDRRKSQDDQDQGTGSENKENDPTKPLHETKDRSKDHPQRSKHVGPTGHVGKVALLQRTSA